MKKSVIVFTAALTAGLAVSCDPEENQPVNPGDTARQLAAPVPELVYQDESSFTLEWEAVSNAGSYVYTLNGGAEENTTGLSVEFTDLAEDDYTVKIKAVAGDTVKYTDSEWAEITVTIDGEETDPARWITFDVYLDTDRNNGYYPYNTVFVHLKTRKAQAVWLGTMSPELDNQECVDELQNNSSPLSSLEVELCNQGGLTFYLSGLEASTEYTVALIVQTSDDDFVFLRKEITTESAADAGKWDKWLGLWTVSSTQTLTATPDGTGLDYNLSDAPMSGTIEIKQRSSNQDQVSITGLTSLGETGIFGDPVAIPAVGELDENGDLVILPAEVASTGNGDILTWFAFLGNEDNSSIVFNKDLPYIFKFSHTGTQIISQPVTADADGVTYTVRAIDVFGVNASGGNVNYYQQAWDMFAGTITLTK